MSTLEENLRPLREQIDEIDQQLLELLNQRGALSLEIGKLKSHADPTLKNIHDPKREQQVLDHITANNSGPFTNQQLQAIFELIIKEHRALQQGIQND